MPTKPEPQACVKNRSERSAAPTSLLLSKPETHDTRGGSRGASANPRQCSCVEANRDFWVEGRGGAAGLNCGKSEGVSSSR